MENAHGKAAAAGKQGEHRPPRGGRTRRSKSAAEWQSQRAEIQPQEASWPSAQLQIEGSKFKARSVTVDIYFQGISVTNATSMTWM